ncbi:MAG: hypothetical protein JO366_09185 [Methylobacteriaceae bacterium]|nr:hypothetical protein [Methylobacteriaceae bacterium]MBV9637126.1 hypothetical protein [Methylobacteriaceae bacterium]MBV9702924.1 hypothetical protein [Methylobacteriaceae bacterium]
MQKTALAVIIVGSVAILAPPTAAQAANTRSWVASFGNDASPCTRVEPCATFGHAVSQTNSGGEINCVDQGDFGGLQVIIDRSITIDCEDVQARTTAPSTPGAPAILVTGPVEAVVTIRGLDINGNGVGGIGIATNGNAVLHIDKCFIHDFTGSNIGWGIQVLAAPSTRLYVSDTVLADNGTSADGGGIDVLPFNVSNSITKVVLNRVEARNGFFGIKADATNATGGVINMTIRDSVSSGNTANGIVGTGDAAGPAIVMMIDHSASSHNVAGFGVIADGPKTTIRLGGSSVTGNINGVGVSNGGVLQSYGNNQINGNSNDGIAALTPIGLH